MKQYEIAERQVWVHQTTERPEWVIIQPVDEHDWQGLDEEVAWLSCHSSATFTLVAFRISDRSWEVPTSQNRFLENPFNHSLLLMTSFYDRFHRQSYIKLHSSPNKT